MTLKSIGRRIAALERRREGELTADQKLKVAALNAKSADAIALESLRKAIPPGRMVRWEHGGQVRMGRVVQVLGFQFDHARVRITSVHGRTYDVGAYAIIKEL